MAESLQLGLDVIATAYGGNTDFCTGPLAHPCADGHVWCEPDLDHAAELMQQRFSLATDGARYLARLEELWAQRERVIPSSLSICIVYLLKL